MALTGGQLPRTLKESYLHALRKADLIELIFRIESSAPNLKLYPSRLATMTNVIDVSQTMSANTSASTDIRAQSFGVASHLDLRQQHQITPTLGLNVQRQQSDYFASQLQPVGSTPVAIGSNESGAIPGPIFTPVNGTVETLSANTVPSSLSSHSKSSSTATGESASALKEARRRVNSTNKEQPNSDMAGTNASTSYNSVKAQDLPPYEEMIFMAIADLREEAGSAPKVILDWVQEHFPVPETFRASCGQAISKAAKKGRLEKDGSLYKLKPGYNYPAR
ncbi:hypothetical protein BGZ94_004674, partial [Podila epigama]